MVSESKKDKVLISGNEAAAEAAIRAGCQFYAGYPITPQNGLIAYMADQLPLRGGSFVQAESELAAVNMVYGASASGVRAMTSSSSPGISLKQEGISYLAGSELPAVIINVQRGGPGLGGIGNAQGDYFQSTRGGGNGDYRCIVLAPASAQEMADMTFLAFDLADKYRTPVLILSDAMTGQLMEGVSFCCENKPDPVPKPWALTGAKGRERNVIHSFYLEQERLERFNRKLQAKYEKIARRETRYEILGAENPEYVLVAFGSSARASKRTALNPPEALAGKLGMFRPKTLWPFPYEELADYAADAKGVLTVEMNAGQMVEDVRLSLEGRSTIYLMDSPGGGIPAEAAIREKLLSLVNNSSTK